VQIGEVEVTKRVHRLVFCLLLYGFWRDLARNFIGSLFPHLSAKFCPNPSNFEGDISVNIFLVAKRLGGEQSKQQIFQGKRSRAGG